MGQYKRTEPVTFPHATAVHLLDARALPPFLQLPIAAWIASNDLAFAIPAPLPRGPGHTLIVPRRLVASYFEATREEKAALWALVDEMKAALDGQLHPDGYEVAFTAGEVAGHTPPHAHVSIIPRVREPVADAPHALRPQRSARSSAPSPAQRRPPLATGGELDPLSQHLWPLFSTATDIAIVAAFVTETGLELLDEWVTRALRAGAQLRIVTGDYLAFNQVDALRLLLVWSQRDGHTHEEAPGLPRRGQLRVRVVETAQPDGTERAFHPKCWLFESPSFGVAFVGSSNLSRSALQTGIEWNLRVERAIDPIAYASVHTAIETLWATAVELTEEWIDAYAQRVRQAPRSLPPGDADDEPLAPPPSPHEFQEEALLALAQARQQGRRRALVVLATGLGKTWLAAFDVARYAASTGQWPRVLFLAHRQELLAQAEHTFRRLLVAAGQPAQVGWCAGHLMQPDRAVVVGSIQKLSRPDPLARIAAERFDYVVVDEVHHADAPTYRRLLDRLDPHFLLGLTATPDRADQGDILGLFDDFVAYRAELGAGIQRGRLAPFAYHGVRDDIDYAQIPWRNHRFDPAAPLLRRRPSAAWSDSGWRGPSILRRY